VIQSCTNIYFDLLAWDHPEVYIFIIPELLISHIIAAESGKKETFRAVGIIYAIIRHRAYFTSDGMMVAIPTEI